MAKSPLLLALSLLGLAVGCTSSGTATAPQPSFNPPVAMANTPPPPAPVYPVKPVIPIKPAPQQKDPVASIGGPAEWRPNAPARHWQYIVIHHSDTSYGSAARFDKFHKEKGWDELGYHFVIGNGTESRDGQVEVGPRWPKQKWGAHTKTPDNRYNDYGIGICLVGNFMETRPTSAQMQSLARLVAYLQKTYKIPSQNIIGHRDAKQTDCPGKNMDIAVVRRMAAQLAEDPGWNPDAKTVAAGEELLQSSGQ